MALGLLEGFSRALGQLHAAGLAPAAGLHLRLHHNLGDAVGREGGGDLPRLLGSVGDLVFQYRNAVLGEEFLSLILEQVHWGSDLGRLLTSYAASTSGFHMKRSRCDAASAAQDADVSRLSAGARRAATGLSVIGMVLSTVGRRQAPSGPIPGVAACRLPVPLQGWRCERSAGRTGRVGAGVRAGDAAAEPPDAHGRRHRRAGGGRRRARGAGHALPHRLDHRAARRPRRRAGRRAPLGRAALAGRAPCRGHRPRRRPDRPAAARPGAAARRADRAGRPLDDARGPRHPTAGRRPGGGLDRVPVRAVHRRGRGREQDRAGGAVAVAGGHRRVRHRASSRAASARRGAWRPGARSPGGCRRARAR